MQHAVVADPEALVEARRVAAAVAFVGLADGGVEGAVVAVLENDVDDAGDGVGAVLRRGAVAQHLDALDGAHRDGVQVGAGGAAPDRGVDVDEGAAVAPLAVHQHQHLIRPQAAQRGGPHRVGAVADGRAGKVEGGNQRLDDAADLAVPGFKNLLLGDHVHRHG